MMGFTMDVTSVIWSFALKFNIKGRFNDLFFTTAITNAHFVRAILDPTPFWALRNRARACFSHA